MAMLDPGTPRTTRKNKIAAGVVGTLALFGVIGSFGQHPTETSSASEARAAGTSTASPSTQHSESLHAATKPSTPTSSATVAPPPPAPRLAMACPAAGSVASPVFDNQITATAPYTVVIDYGDGDVYTDDDQHLGAIFSHTYQRAGAFLVHALLTDATGQTAQASCTYSWTAPAPVVRGGSSGGGSGSASSGGPVTGSGAGDTYTNVDGQQVQRPVEAPSAPPGATAHCEDGTWSFSQHRQGTCSGHGGVAVWL